mgnify:CR=1 FL=1
MNLTDSQIFNWIQPTGLCKLTGVSQQAVNLTPCSAFIMGQSRQVNYLGCQVTHMGTIGEMALTIGSIQMS